MPHRFFINVDGFKDGTRYIIKTEDGRALVVTNDLVNPVGDITEHRPAFEHNVNIGAWKEITVKEAAALAPVPELPGLVREIKTFAQAMRRLTRSGRRTPQQIRDYLHAEGFMEGDLLDLPRALYAFLSYHLGGSWSQGEERYEVIQMTQDSENNNWKATHTLHIAAYVAAHPKLPSIAENNTPAPAAVKDTP